MPAEKRFLPKQRWAFICLAVLLPVALGACAGISGRSGGEAGPPPDMGSGAQDLRLARAARSAGDFGSAVNLYRTVLDADPGNASIQVELGDTFLEIGAIDDAIQTFNKVAGDSPARLDAELGLAHTQLALHKPEAALEFLDRAGKSTPDDPRVLIGRGVALDYLGRHTEAQSNYRTVLKEAPEHVAARNNLALSLALAGDFPQAIDIMTQLMRSTAVTPRIRQNLALIYGLKGDAQQSAAISRLDLDEKDTEENLRLFGMLRNGD